VTKSDDHRVGITPIAIRRAAFYAQLGEGHYYPNHPHFDEVIVRRLYDVTQNPENELEWAFGTRVEFHQHGRCVRWIEFSSRLVGAGGDDILRKVNVDG
jgi:hypothetical protein